MDTTEKAFYSAFLIGWVIIGLILAFFLYSIIRQQKRYRLLAQAKINAEITTLENERKRIASDLHDEVGPLLSAVKLQINHLEGMNEAQQGLIERSSGYIDDVIKKMREISNDLLPNILVRRGLEVAVESFLEKLQSGTTTQIECSIILSKRLPLDLEVNIYRIIQEITHNTLKHAQASRFRIELTEHNGFVRLATADNGVGFKADVYNRSESGLGLLNLQSRSDVMGGEFNCSTSPGKGTRYLFDIPLQTLPSA
jgi:signal transduction histidine kinase